ncbi:replication initiator protein [Paraburkholderia caballeronis]|nr:replication initiator protein [Paraburkholderia caballeronis]
MLTKATALTEASALTEEHALLLNDLLGAFHGLKTEAEERIVAACMAKLGSVRSEQGRSRIKLTAAEYADTFGLDPADAYQQLKTVAQSLLVRVVRREEQTRRGVRVHLDHWASGITLHDRDAWVELRFSHEATLYMVALKGDYSAYLLKQAAGLRSIHSWSLLEVFLPLLEVGSREMTIDEFVDAMGVKPVYAASFARLRREVIEPAVKELTEKDGWQIAWQPVKEGRKAVAVQFTFRRSPQGRLDV